MYVTNLVPRAIAIVASIALTGTLAAQQPTPATGHISDDAMVVSPTQEPTAQAAPTAQSGVYQPVVASNGCCGTATGCDAGCDGFAVAGPRRLLGGGCGIGGGLGCDSGCDGGACGCGMPASRFSLLGRNFLKRSDHCYDDFISPITNPVFFEDPRNVTEARFIYINHQVPTQLGGGHVSLYALQLRARLSENVSLIATKDGYISSTNPVVNDGWADLAAGLKFNLLSDPQAQRLTSAGFTYELPSGEASAFQGNGDGELNLFITHGRQIGCRSHWISAGGIRLPFDDADESTSSYWSNHFDYQIRQGLYFIAEANWYHWLGAGQNGPLNGVEGLDIINFGNPGVAGNDIVTGALGVKVKPNGHNELGVAWEVPLTQRRDIIENRFTFDWIIRY